MKNPSAVTGDWREDLKQGDRVMCQLGPETGLLAFGTPVSFLLWKLCPETMTLSLKEIYVHHPMDPKLALGLEPSLVRELLPAVAV